MDRGAERPRVQGCRRGYACGLVARPERIACSQCLRDDCRMRDARRGDQFDDDADDENSRLIRAREDRDLVALIAAKLGTTPGTLHRAILSVAAPAIAEIVAAMLADQQGGAT